MLSASKISDQNLINFTQTMNGKSQKRIKYFKAKTQTSDTSFQTQTTCQMESTKYNTTRNSIAVVTETSESHCTCRSKVTSPAPFPVKKILLTGRLLKVTNILLLATILPIINTKNIPVSAVPTHQSNPTTLPETASLVSKATVPNSINSTVMAITELQSQSLKVNSVQNAVPALGSTAHPEHNRALKKAWLSNRTITCNDGTAAGFYLRKNPNSKKWIVFLEGGWHCYDVKTCRARWNKLRHLMTSTEWPETRDIGGILSASPEENPYWHSANHVLVPYCSSDSWSGTKDTFESNEFSFRFMGASILKQAIADLIPMGLGRVPGSELLLAGSSAGGLGVLLNLDRITHFLQHERNLQVTVRGVSDSGWFLDREPYAPSAVASSDAVRQGWSLWKGLLPEACVEQHKSEPWRCYFGYRLYPTLKAPLFVFQWLFDEAQMRADNVADPVTPHQWNYIHAMGGALRSSLDNVTAVFAPSCIGHAVLSKRDWTTLKIDDISLPTALRCWEHSTRVRKNRHDKLKRSTEASVSNKNNNKRRHEKQHREKQRDKKKKNNNNDNRNNVNGEKKRLSKAEREERKQLRHEQQKRREERRNRRKNNMVAFNESNQTNALHLSETPTDAQNNQMTAQRKTNKHKRNELDKQKKNSNRQRKRQHKRKEQNSLDVQQPERDLQKEQPLVVVVQKRANKINRRSGVPRVPERCSLRLLERCSWPQCNNSCPTLTNPVTGEEMRFLELLASFGLDIEAVAAALGVDMQTLNNMDRTELVNMLTQQVS